MGSGPDILDGGGGGWWREDGPPDGSPDRAGHVRAGPGARDGIELSGASPSGAGPSEREPYASRSPAWRGDARSRRRRLRIAAAATALLVLGAFAGGIVVHVRDQRTAEAAAQSQLHLSLADERVTTTSRNRRLALFGADIWVQNLGDLPLEVLDLEIVGVGWSTDPLSAGFAVAPKSLAPGHLAGSVDCGAVTADAALDLRVSASVRTADGQRHALELGTVPRRSDLLTVARTCTSDLTVAVRDVVAVPDAYSVRGRVRLSVQPYDYALVADLRLSQTTGFVMWAQGLPLRVAPDGEADVDLHVRVVDCGVALLNQPSEDAIDVRFANERTVSVPVPPRLGTAMVRAAERFCRG